MHVIKYRNSFEPKQKSRRLVSSDKHVLMTRTKKKKKGKCERYLIEQKAVSPTPRHHIKCRNIANGKIPWHIIKRKKVLPHSVPNPWSNEKHFHTFLGEGRASLCNTNPIRFLGRDS